MPIRPKNAPPEPAYTVNVHELHWAMHAVVSGCSRERYDAMAPLPHLPPAKTLPEPLRPRRRRGTAQPIPIFDPCSQGTP
jgi:hypothetical protein